MIAASTCQWFAIPMKIHNLISRGSWPLAVAYNMNSQSNCDAAMYAICSLYSCHLSQLYSFRHVHIAVKIVI